MFENDYLVRQIESISRVLSTILLKKDLPNNSIEDNLIKKDKLSNEEILENELKEMIQLGNINEAENLLFENIEKDNFGRYLKTALFFYTELNKLNDNTLKKYGFLRDEILDGLGEVKRIYKTDELTTFIV